MVGRRLNKLTALQVKNAKSAGYLSDGGGLYLRVSTAGKRSWVFIFDRDGRRREMGLGPFPDVSLEDARQQAMTQRKVLLAGDDPIDQRQAAQLSKKADAAKLVTFRAAAERYIESQRSGWKNAKHAAQWESTLQAYAFPIVGEVSVAQIDTGLVLKVIEPIWREKTETASRVRGRIEAVLEWAKTREYRAGDNPARWHGHLENLLPRRSDVARVKHQPALPFDRLSAFMSELRLANGIAARCLEFTILTAVRSGEARLAKWNEFDLDAGVWSIPADRMKAKKEHRVPLSGATLKILEGLPRFDGCEFVFVSGKRNAPLSDMALTGLIRRMNNGSDPPRWVDRDGRAVVAHGFRSTFRDWAAERTSFPREVAEMALAHAIPSAVEASYRRGDLFEKRRRLMSQWAALCSTKGGTEAGQVLSFERERAA